MEFEEIYRTYAGRILNLTYRMTQREEVARDLTQDIFLKVYEGLEGFNRQSEIYTWIYRIAVNHVLNHLKREKRVQRLDQLKESVARIVQKDGSESGLAGRSVPDRADFEMERTERAKIVWTAVCSLPPKYRVPLVLHQYENVSYKEIAEMMDLSMSTVETRIHRAKQRLLKILGPLAGQL